MKKVDLKENNVSGGIPTVDADYVEQHKGERAAFD